MKLRSAATTGFAILSLVVVLLLAALPFLGYSGAVAIHAEASQESAPRTQTEKTKNSGLPESPPSAQSPSQEGVANTSLKIASWNVRDCAAYDSASKERISLHDYVAATIRESGADVAILQEIQSDESKGGDIALLSVALAKQGWAMPYTAVVNAKGEDDLAVFSRYKIVAQGEILQPAANESWPRPGIYSLIEIGDGKLHVYGFHFKAMGDSESEAARKAQARALALALKSRHGDFITTDSIVLAGDFNTANPGDLEAKNSTLSLLTLAEDGDPSNDFLALNYRFLPGSPSFVDTRYSSVLDHILVSPSLKAGLSKDSIRLLEPLPGPGPIPTSDHKLLLAEIALSKR